MMKNREQYSLAATRATEAHVHPRGRKNANWTVETNECCWRHLRMEGRFSFRDGWGMRTEQSGSREVGNMQAPTRHSLQLVGGQLSAPHPSPRTPPEKVHSQAKNNVSTFFRGYNFTSRFGTEISLRNYRFFYNLLAISCKYFVTSV
jgi:hypothetical protein